VWLGEIPPAGSWNGWMMMGDCIMDGLLWCLSYRLVNFAILINSELFTSVSRTMVCNKWPYVGVLMYMFRSSVCDSSDLPGYDPATLNGMVLYYRLMTKWSGLGDSTKLSRMGLSQTTHTMIVKLSHEVVVSWGNGHFLSPCSLSLFHIIKNPM
jgi:hypothetical protein